MKTFYAAEQKRHDPKFFLSSGGRFPNPEQPERVERLLEGARAAGLDVARPADHGLGPISAIHTPEYLDFLKRIYQRWQHIEGASEEVIPNIHPIARAGSYPASAVGQAGYHMADTSCPISAETWESACWSAWSAVSAADAVMAGDAWAYALCRPPGHHAFRDVAGGFCFFNNSAIAAQRLRRSAERVAIIDVDLHHGNGTQGVFYERNDVLTVSIHADPVRFYPFFWGHADERGEGLGLGYNYNLPLPRRSDDAAYLEALSAALRRVEAFSPDAIVIALGLDAFEKDPFGGLSVTTPGFALIGKAIAKLGRPAVIVQEGGYLCDELGDNLTSFLTGYGAKAV
ncbi:MULTISPECIES: histone deacetylase family protein [Alphaproteobacteria]|uniref:Acetylpolyamine amidohydrolase n=2 Tax=Alphaproteobacteria TaxID=28211 RepID=A0A512HIK0_9HYPH|nr:MULTISPECIES: histone deacetylase family protein [Alphaproteobacteria]GEO85279.1 acetylpolyamine amidohydrolase [Ciceribacter naphthalenivorans]GLR20918.1 acetylpolyamine amidohydrolase [Ciceribacter naphthalenivorans]GLT03774.1 acetylpolyamine amidohydrolase [Sphingomonas psychrolutea]